MDSRYIGLFRRINMISIKLDAS